MRAPGPLGRVLALARFSVAANLGSGLSRAGLASGLGVMLLGTALSLQRGDGWALDREIAFVGFLIMALFVVRSGLEEQRELGLGTFLRHNLVSPVEHGLGLVLGLLALWAGLCGLTFGAVFVLSGGDVSVAAWSAARWGLRLLVVLGFVPLVEMMATVRLPLVLPVLAYFLLLITLSLIMPEERALALFIPVEHGQAGQLARLGIQGAASLALTSAAFLLLTVFGPGLGRRLRNFVPFSHGSAPHGE